VLAAVPDVSSIVCDARDSAAINAVLNDPAVRPFIGLPDAGEVDISPLVVNPMNLFPFGEHGGFALLWTAPHTREVHTFILPSGRGRWAQQAAAEGIEMARDAGTRTLWTKVPADAPHVRAFASVMGMDPTGEAVTEHGAAYEIMAMELDPCL